MHVLVVTHLSSCVEVEDSSFIPFLHDGRLSGGSCFALKPLVSHLAYASEVIPIRSQYLLAQVITGLVKVIQGNTITLAHSDEPYLQKHGKIVETPIPRTRTRVEDAAP